MLKLWNVFVSGSLKTRTAPVDAPTNSNLGVPLDFTATRVMTMFRSMAAFTAP